jgi:hypothetical protein
MRMSPDEALRKFGKAGIAGRALMAEYPSDEKLPRSAPIVQNPALP